MQLDGFGKFQIVPRGFGEQEVFVGGHRIFQQPVDDDHVHARQLHEIEDAMEQRLAAVDDDLEPEFFDVRAGIAGASRGVRSTR